MTSPKVAKIGADRWCTCDMKINMKVKVATIVLAKNQSLTLWNRWKQIIAADKLLKA